MNDRSEAFERELGAALERRADHRVELPTTDAIVNRGRKRARRRHRALAGLSAMAALGAIAGVGSAIGDDPATEVAAGAHASDAEADWLLAVPSVFVAVDGGFVGLAHTSDPQDNLLQLVSSADGIEWEPIEGGRLDGWLHTPSSSGWAPVGFAEHAGTVHLVSTGIEVGADTREHSGADSTDLALSENTPAAILALVRAEFDLATAEWDTWVEPAVVELASTDFTAVSIDAAAADFGVFAEIALQTDSLAGTGWVWTELCDADWDSRTVELRACGSTTVDEFDWPGSALESFAVFAEPGEPAEVVRSPEHGWRGPNAVYAFEGGIGLAGRGSSAAWLSGETIDGENWTEVHQSFARPFAVAARGDERVAITQAYTSGSGSEVPLWVLRYSESSDLDVVVHHEVGPDEDARKIRSMFAVSTQQLEQANPGVDLDQLRPGDVVVVPDREPDRRNWRSVDVGPVLGTRRTSPTYFELVEGGPAGFVVTARQEVGVDHGGRDLGEVHAFRIEHDGMVFDGWAPFGPATVRTVGGELVEQWDHFETARPDQHGTVDVAARLLSIDVFAPDDLDHTGGPVRSIDFPLDDWFEVVSPDDQGEVGSVDLLWSPNGLDWSIVGTVEGFVPVLAVDETGVVVLVTGRHYPETVRFDFPQ